jgi:predicted DNA-binding transcriptional regulator AlpA
MTDILAADLWDMEDIADWTGLSIGTIRNMSYQGTLPNPALRKAGSPLWDRKTIQEWRPRT